MLDKHLEPLTWLRGFAAFFVVIHHCFYTASVSYAEGDIPSYFSPLNFLDLGTFAVALFFALSGCTLALNYSNHVNSAGSYGRFVVKRFMRIWPAFAVSLLLCLIFKEVFKHFYIGSTDHWVAYLLSDYSIVNIFQYLSLTFNITGPKNLFLNVYWTLPVEFQYYLLLPIALFFMKNRYSEVVVPAIFGAMAYVIYHKHWLVLDSPAVFKMAYIFFGGMIVASLYRRLQFRIPLIHAIVFFGVMVVLLGALRNELLVIPQTLPFLSDIANVYGLCAILLVAVGAFTRAPQQPNAIFDFLKHYGEISYSIYLFHIFFVGTAALFIVNFHIFGGVIKLLFLLSFSLIGVYYAACMTHRYIELPSIALGRNLTRRSVRPVAMEI